MLKGAWRDESERTNAARSQGHPLQDGVVTAPVRAPHPAGVVEVCEGPLRTRRGGVATRPRAARIRRRLARPASRPAVTSIGNLPDKERERLKVASDSQWIRVYRIRRSRISVTATSLAASSFPHDVMTARPAVRASHRPAEEHFARYPLPKAETLWGAGFCQQLFRNTNLSSEPFTSSRFVDQYRRPHRKLSTSMRLLPALFTSENSSLPSGDNAMPYHHGFPRSTTVLREPVANSKKSIEVLCRASPTATK